MSFLTSTPEPARLMSAQDQYARYLLRGFWPHQVDELFVFAVRLGVVSQHASTAKEKESRRSGVPRFERRWMGVPSPGTGR